MGWLIAAFVLVASLSALLDRQFRRNREIWQGLVFWAIQESEGDNTHEILIRLQAAFGVEARPRELYGALRALESAGYISSSVNSRGSTGRPLVTYTLTGPRR